MKFLISFLLAILLSYLEIFCFADIFTSPNISINLYFTTINLSSNSPLIWKNIKYLFILFSFLAKFILIYQLIHKVPIHYHKRISNKSKNLSDNLCLYIGESISPKKPVIISESGLYQNILITGSIGSGKTSSAMYPITKQLLKFSPKIGMLILDVKGNYISQVKEYARLYGREDDIISIEIGGYYKYNPLFNSTLKPSVIANRLKTILLLFSPNNSESYWVDKSETVLAEAITLCRLYNDGYVTFNEIHSLVTDHDYYLQKTESLRKLFIENKFNKNEVYDLLSALNFFEKEFFSLDLRTLNILKSEITRITNCFVSDSEVLKTFCPPQEELNFLGFDEVISSGKIVVLNMNINEYRNLSKIIAAYLKLDFQTEVMRRLAKANASIKPVAFISDEYSEYVSATDANFFSQSRESKCINVVSTQSYTSLLNALNNKYSVEVIVQNLVNKLWFRSDDTYTIEDAQKQIGKSEKEKSSKTISENAKQTSYNFFVRSLQSKDSSISESINTYMQYDYTYDTNFFTQNLHTFECLAFLSDGTKILEPVKVKMNPFFKERSN